MRLNKLAFNYFVNIGKCLEQFDCKLLTETQPTSSSLRQRGSKNVMCVGFCAHLIRNPFK